MSSDLKLLVGVAAFTLLVSACGAEPVADILHDDKIVNADLWAEEPEIMAAGLGFTGINGVADVSTDNLQLGELRSRLAGGNWNTLQCAEGQVPTIGNYTSTATPETIATVYGEQTNYADGYPIEFSWPVLPSSVAPSDFELTLNNGDKVSPEVASVFPNFEYNERSMVVIFGHFGNRIPPGEAGLIWPTSIEVVPDDTPLQLVGPGGVLHSAVGLTVQSPPPSAYTDPDVAPKDRGGPTLAAAKLSRMSEEGEGGPKILSQNFPNSGTALYGDAAQYRLRVYTTGGMTPDGVRGLFPTDFSRFFRVKAKSNSGEDVLLTETGKDYEIDGKTVRVVGLADLGLKESQYTDCYIDDRDNYIDIILNGDEDSVKKITHVDIPSTGDYSPLYNPGGPGNNPTPNVRYAAPSPPISQLVTMAIDDPMTVSYPPK